MTEQQFLRQIKRLLHCKADKKREILRQLESDIARGESLGEKRLQAIIDIAKANGFQGFIEEVKRGQTDLVVEEYTENE